MRPAEAHTKTIILDGQARYYVAAPDARTIECRSGTLRRGPVSDASQPPCRDGAHPVSLCFHQRLRVRNSRRSVVRAVKERGLALVRAYILIEMVAGHSRKLVASLQGRASVVGVDRVTGPFDVVAVLEGEDINAISDIVTSEVHSLEGVVRTTTCVCLE